MNKKMTSLSRLGAFYSTGLLWRLWMEVMFESELQRGCNGEVVKRSGRREV